MREAECACEVLPEEAFDSDVILVTVRDVPAGRLEVRYGGAVAGTAHLSEPQRQVSFSFLHEGGHQEAGAFAVYTENGHAQATVSIRKRRITDCERKAADIRTELINATQPLPSISELLRLQKILRR